MKKPLKDVVPDVVPEDFKTISTPEDKALLKKWNKILREEGLTKDPPREQSLGSLGDLISDSPNEEHDGNTQAVMEAHEIKDPRRAKGNKWRAGENAPERHLVPQAPWLARVPEQTQSKPRRGERIVPPEWANNDTLILQVLQAQFPYVDWSAPVHSPRSRAARWSGAIQLVWKEGQTSIVAAKELRMKASDLRKFLTRIRRYAEKVLK